MFSIFIEMEISHRTAYGIHDFRCQSGCWTDFFSMFFTFRCGCGCGCRCYNLYILIYACLPFFRVRMYLFVVVVPYFAAVYGVFFVGFMSAQFAYLSVDLLIISICTRMKTMWGAALQTKQQHQQLQLMITSGKMFANFGVQVMNTRQRKTILLISWRSCSMLNLFVCCCDWLLLNLSSLAACILLHLFLLPSFGTNGKIPFNNSQSYSYDYLCRVLGTLIASYEIVICKYFLAFVSHSCFFLLFFFYRVFLKKCGILWNHCAPANKFTAASNAINILCSFLITFAHPLRWECNAMAAFSSFTLTFVFIHPLHEINIEQRAF